MADRFDTFRLSLIERPRQGDLFAQLEPEAPSRESYLRAIFAERHIFGHRGNELHYVPVSTADSRIAAARVGRAHRVIENLPPDQGLELAEHEGWKAAAVVLDPRPHNDGQKLFVGYNIAVGLPFALARALIKHLNSVHERDPYHIEVEPIFNPKTFWDFADAHQGEITSLKFEFATPNMFGGVDEITTELRRFREKEHAQRVTVQLNSDSGLRTDTPNVNQSVEYAQRGGGAIKARARGGYIYNSTRMTASITVESTDGASASEALTKAVSTITSALK